MEIGDRVTYQRTFQVGRDDFNGRKGTVTGFSHSGMVWVQFDGDSFNVELFEQNLHTRLAVGDEVEYVFDGTQGLITELGAVTALVMPLDGSYGFTTHQSHLRKV
jgi:hypothetical protein